MKNTLTFSFLLILSILSWHCNTPNGTTIKGTIANASNLQVFVDKVVIGQASQILDKADIGNSGNFSLNFPEGLEMGVYNIRIGAQRVNLILDGTENVVELTGDLNQFPNYQVSIKGSDDSEAFAQTMRALIARKYQPNDIQNLVDTASNPLLGAFVSYVSLSQTPQLVDIQKKANEKLAEVMPNSEFVAGYARHIAMLEAQYQQQMASEKIKVGQPAPDIEMKSPDGKTYALSDLKGKVVLLDFWASWCGPCRRENPNVVKVYEKYKNQGFTVFSVSLDRQGQEDRWKAAIEKDGLSWPYHVSDLQYWDSAPARMYGVSGIPKAFMIDREGNIAAVGVRGAADIEQELKKLL